MQPWHLAAMLVLLGIGYMLFARASLPTRTTSTPPSGSSNALFTSLLALGEGIYSKATASTTQDARDTQAMDWNDSHSPPPHVGVNEDKDGNEWFYVTD